MPFIIDEELMSSVLPGFWLVLASLGLWQSMLMSDDLPTLLRPMNAYSGSCELGQLLTSGLEMIYCAVWIIWMLDVGCLMCNV